MNTVDVFGTRPEFGVCEREISWITEREHDLASWLDEVDLELHEQMVCGSIAEESETRRADK